MTAARALRRLWRDRLAVLGALLVMGAVVVAVLAPVLAPADPIKNRLLDRLTPPAWMSGGSVAHLLGTDTLGRDVASRLLHGARVSLAVAFIAVLLSGLVGIVLGLVAGYYPGRLDDVLMRLGDIQLAFPALVLAIAVLAVLGASLSNVILVLALTGWVTFARIVRGETLSLRHREFVDAARALGARDAAILARHILPNVLPPLVVVATFSVARTVIAEASLSFLGLGIPPPAPSWGAMLDEGPELPHHRVVAGPLSGSGDLVPRAGDQPRGGLASRRARSPPRARDGPRRGRAVPRTGDSRQGGW